MCDFIKHVLCAVWLWERCAGSLRMGGASLPTTVSASSSGSTPRTVGGAQI